MLNNRIIKWYPPLLICLLGIIVYSNTFHVPFVFDDFRNIVENPAIRNLWNLTAIWNFCATRFVTFFSLALNYHFHKLSLPGYHIFNLAVHLGSAILVYWFILLTFSTPYFNPHPRGLDKSSPYTPNVGVQFIEPEGRVRNLLALFGALLFVCHPIQTQAVTYIIQRAASFATFWYLLTLCLYAKARLSVARQPSASRPYYLCSIISAALALFTKETAITLPFMLLLWELCFFEKLTKTSIKRTAPFFTLLFFTLMTIRITGSINFENLRKIDPGFYATATISSKNYLLTQFRVIVTYIRLLLIPINQNLDYDYPIARSLFNLPVFASLILLLIILATGFILFRRYRLISFSIFWFFLVLVPESSFIPIKDVIFEHRLYLPMVGYALFLPSALYYLFSRIKLPVPCILSTVYCLLPITLGYSTLTYMRNRVWQDEVTLWNDVIHKSPHKARVYFARGTAYTRKGQYEQAIQDYNQAIRINPFFGDVYYNRGLIYVTLGKYDQALADYNRILAIDPVDVSALCNRGSIWFQKQEYQKAIIDYTRALKFNPNYVEAWNNQGLAYAAIGDYEKAIGNYTRALTLSPDYVAGYFNRAVAFGKRNEHQKAISDLGRVIEMAPGWCEAYYNRAVACIAIGEYAKAKENIRKLRSLGYPINPQLLKLLP